MQGTRGLGNCELGNSFWNIESIHLTNKSMDTISSNLKREWMENCTSITKCQGNVDITLCPEIVKMHMKISFALSMHVHLEGKN